MITIESSVGNNGKNLPVDVIKIQNLLNNNDLYAGLTSPLPVIGEVNDAMIESILKFQKNHPKIKDQPKWHDGRVDPSGRVLLLLNDFNNSTRSCRSYYPAGFNSNQVASLNVERFVKLFSLQYPPLGADAGGGFRTLVNAMVADPEMTNICWVAYMLATVKHECANTWRPIEEFGKGAGRDYGKAVSFTDPEDKKVYTNIYYGRGYVQLTWGDNYKKMDAALNLSGGDSLYLHPENALISGVAYRIMSYGMRNGSFTTRKLSDYIFDGAADYINARKIINGVDQAGTIAGYAGNIEFLLRFCNGA